MFRKQAVCVSTAAGGGMRSTVRDMADSTFYWGVAKTWKLGAAVAAVSWDGVSAKKKECLDRKTAVLAGRIRKNAGHVSPSFKTRIFFHVMRLVQKNGWCEPDRAYWKEKGWTGNVRPWKSQRERT